jgi:hypothetical protein
MFLPTFPIDKMTASELEHSVTSPYRFTTILKQPAVVLDACNELSPHVTRILHCNPAQLHNITAIYLVPGG